MQLRRGSVCNKVTSIECDDTLAEHLVLPKIKIKEIWRHFGFEKEGGPKDLNNPTCKHCHKKVPAKGSNTCTLNYGKKHPTSIYAAFAPAGL